MDNRNLPLPASESHQIPQLPCEGLDSVGNFFKDIPNFNIFEEDFPELLSSGEEFDLADIFSIDPLSEDDLSICLSSAPLPPNPNDVGHSLPVEHTVVATGHGRAGDGAGKKSCGAEGSVVQQVSITKAAEPCGLLRNRRMTKEKFEELLRVDPKKAKRIAANRASAARSKNKKILYESGLKERVKANDIKIASLDAELEAVEKDCTATISRIEELNRYMDAMQQGAPLRTGSIEQLRREVQDLRIKTGVTGNLGNNNVQLPEYSTPLASHQIPPPPPPPQPLFDFDMLPPLPSLPPSPYPIDQPEFNVQGDFSFFDFNPPN